MSQPKKPIKQKRRASYELEQVHKSVRFNRIKDADILKFLEDNRGDFNFNQFVKTKLREELRKAVLSENSKKSFANLIDENESND